MGESKTTTPVKTPTKSKKDMASKPKTNGDQKSSSAQKTSKHPSFNDMIISAISELTQGKTKGTSYSGVSHYVKREFEFGRSSDKVINTNIRAAIGKLVTSGEVTTTDGPNLNTCRFKLNAVLRKKVRDAAKKASDEDESPVKLKVIKKKSSETKTKKEAPAKKTPTKKQVQKTKASPKKPSVKRMQKSASNTNASPKKSAKA